MEDETYEDICELLASGSKVISKKPKMELWLTILNFTTKMIQVRCLVFFLRIKLQLENTHTSSTFYLHAFNDYYFLDLYYNQYKDKRIFKQFLA